MPTQDFQRNSNISQLKSRKQPVEVFCAGVSERRKEIETLGRIPDDIVESMRQIGLYRSLVPKTLGGDEKSPVEFLQLVEQIAAADGSVGWVASFAGAATYLSGLPSHRFEEFYADGPDVVFAAGLFPVQPAQKKGNKLVLDGRWKFASGCSGADWLGVGIMVDDSNQSAKPRVIIFPRDRAKLIDEWDVVGLAGTGSYDLVLDNIEIEEDWSFVRGGETTRTEPIYRFPIIPFSALNHAIIGIGVALGALKEVQTAYKRDANASQLAKATAELLSTRALMFRQTEHVWNTVCASKPVPLQDQCLLRLASKLASEAAITACRTALVNIDPDESTPAQENIARYLRDALVVGQHAFLSPAIYEQGGQVLIYETIPPGFL